MTNMIKNQDSAVAGAEPHTMVIYHRADFDGLFSREVARRWLSKGGGVVYCGWDYNDPLPVVPEAVRELYMIDISVKGLMDDPRLIWIDHHATAMREFGNHQRGYRVDGVAACRLAWQWFLVQEGFRSELPDAEAYRARALSEPEALVLAGEYDVHYKLNDWNRVELFQAGLRSQELQWDLLTSGAPSCAAYIDRLIEAGRHVQFASRETRAWLMREGAFDIEWLGLRWLAINAGGSVSSGMFETAVRPDHDACLSFGWAPKKRAWKVSMRGIDGRGSVDLGEIAQRFGGGGHRGAAGFVCQFLPFTLPGEACPAPSADWHELRTAARLAEVASSGGGSPMGRTSWHRLKNALARVEAVKAAAAAEDDDDHVFVKAKDTPLISWVKPCDWPLPGGSK